MANKKFPHESTTDQWFSEQQFESYRSLGTFIVRGAFEENEDLTIEKLADLAVENINRQMAKQEAKSEDKTLTKEDLRILATEFLDKISGFSAASNVEDNGASQLNHQAEADHTSANDNVG